MRTPPRAGTRAMSGFTLVEVLVTLLIMGVIMGAISSILASARNTRDTIYNVQEMQLAGPAIMDMIERDLRALFTYDRPREHAFRVIDRVLLGRDADSLDFVTKGDSLTPIIQGRRYVRTATNEVGYRLRENPDNRDFLEIYRREDLGIDDEPFDGGTYSFLHDRVRHFNIEIFTEDGVEAEPLEEWGTDARTEDEIGIPTRVEIALELELAPRVMRQQLTRIPLDKRRITYRRIIRLPEVLRRAEELQPVPKVPVIQPPGEPESGSESEPDG